MYGVLWNVRERIRVLGVIPQPTANDLNQMSRDQLAQSISEQVVKALGEMAQGLDSSEIRKLVIKEHTKLEAALSSEDWVKLLPGKPIFSRFCGEFFAVESARVREAYADIAIGVKPEVFQDIIQIFQAFSRIATPI